MNTLHERVTLPDTESQPLVHPLDVVEGRRAYQQAWLMSTLGSAQFLVLVGAISWLATRSYVAPAVAVLSTGILAEVARRHLAAEAWSHIPRSRQDQKRSDPSRLSQARTVIETARLVAGVVLVLAGLAQQGYDSGIRAYSLGAAAGLGTAMIAMACTNWWIRRSTSAAFEMSCVVMCVAAGTSTVWAAASVPSSPNLATALLGAVVLGALYGAWGLLTGRRKLSELAR